MKRKYVSMLLTVVLTISTVCQSAYGAKSEETMTQETDSVVERVIEEGNAQDLEETVEEISVEEIAEETAIEEELTEEVSLQISEASLEDLLKKTTESVIEITESESKETEGILSETATTEEVKSIEKSVRKAVKQAASAEVKAEGVCGDNLTWVLTTDGVLTISGTGAMWDMKADQYWHPYREDIYSVVIEEGAENVGNYAFYEFENLKDVKLANSIKDIGEVAFCGCNSLTYIDIPDGIEKIGKQAFIWCNNLKKIKLPDSIKIIGERAFAYCGNLSEINIPEGIIEIASGICDGCDLKSIDIPDSVQEIGSWAFSSNKLTEIVIPDSVQEIETIEEIGDYAFYNAGGHTVTIPATVTCIGEKAFGYHDNWTRTGMEKNDIIIKGELGTEAERYAQINDFTFTIHNSDLVVSGKCGENVFYEIRGTEKDGYNLTISGFGDMYDDYENEIKPYNPKGSRPGWDGFQIKDVKILDGVTSIGDYAFIQLDADRMIIPLSVKKIGQNGSAPGCARNRFSRLLGSGNLFICWRTFLWRNCILSNR